MENLNEFLSWFWWILGATLIFLEFILPGLVSVFIGIGALTTAALYHYGYIDSITWQLLSWMIFSLVYCFTLRLLVIKFYPSDTEVQNIDEDFDMDGEIVEVVEDIDASGSGRVGHSDTSWPAKSNTGSPILKGTKVKVIGRENITWLVTKINE